MDSQSPCCCHSSWKRSVKRKLDRIAADFSADGLDACVARVEIENERAALREALSRQQQTIQELYLELDEERSASASAANETMSMILRLQREKAEVQMEARQFKRFAEEKMAHDQQELLALEDVLYKRDQLIQSLTFEIQAYKHRLMSFGCIEHEAEGSFEEEASGVQFEFPSFNYPRLKCDPNEVNVSQAGHDDGEAPFDLDKYPSGETPRQCLQDLEFRIQQLEQGTGSSRMNGEGYPSTRNFVKKVAVGLSPQQPSRFSTDSRSSSPVLVKETNVQDTLETPRTVVIGSIEKSEDFMEGDLRKADGVSGSWDDMGDRIYTVDSMQTKATVKMCYDHQDTPQEPITSSDVMETDIKKLYLRLQALEADRESMRQAIISMRTEKAQLVLLREIAQQLCKEMPPGKRVSVKKTSLISGFSLTPMLKVLFVHKYSGAMMLDSAILISLSYFLATVNAAYAQHLTNGFPDPPVDLLLPGVLLFLIGISGNFYHHFLLSKLRSKDEKGYKIPKGGLFGLVICPHYLFEIVEFVGIAFIAQTIFAFAFTLGTTSYLMGRSYATRKWYLSKFPNFPRQVKALFPFLF